jgi:hypothetical protein
MSISIRLAQSDGLTAGVPARLAHSGTRTGVAIIVLRYSNPPSCTPLLHSHYRSFLATMGALTPAQPGSSGLASMNSGSFSEQVSLIHTLSLLTIPSPTTWPPRWSLFHATPQRQRSRFPGPDFALGMQAHRGYPAESSFLSYGLVVHLLLLPTPPLGDAVAFGFRPESVYLERTCTSLTARALRRTCHGLAPWSLTLAAKKSPTSTG